MQVFYLCFIESILTFGEVKELVYMTHDRHAMRDWSEVLATVHNDQIQSMADTMDVIAIVTAFVEPFCHTFILPCHGSRAI